MNISTSAYWSWPMSYFHCDTLINYIKDQPQKGNLPATSLFWHATCNQGQQSLTMAPPKGNIVIIQLSWGNLSKLILHCEIQLRALWIKYFIFSSELWMRHQSLKRFKMMCWMYWLGSKPMQNLNCWGYRVGAWPGRFRWCWILEVKMPTLLFPTLHQPCPLMQSYDRTQWLAYMASLFNMW